MKRMHVMLKVGDLDESVRFYTHLFGAAPTTRKADYAKWMLDDPRVNFSIAPAASRDEAGIEHLGIQAESEAVRDEGNTTCCYANSDKTWVRDPQGVEWEAFFTYGESDTYFAEETACCEPECCA